MAKNITIVIPTYEQKGMGLHFAKRILDSIEKQTYKDYDVVVSDNSTYFAREAMKDLCSKYSFVTYVTCDNRGIAPNTNNAMKHATGNLIKVMCQDDYFLDEDSLQITADSFEREWMVSSCAIEQNGEIVRYHQPKYNDKIYLGENTISNQSVLTITNGTDVWFDENLSMLVDVDYYKQLYDKFGEPTICVEPTVVIGLSDTQLTHTISEEAIQKEIKYTTKKYEN